MTLPLTKEVLAAAYDYLASTEPFARWNMPDAEDILFSVVRSPSEFAHYTWDGKRHTIAVSSRAVGHTSTLLIVMSHEMIHLHLEATGMESKGGDRNTHNMAFRKLAARVCKVHGFDVKAFY
jgi:hypothetical protein